MTAERQRLQDIAEHQTAWKLWGPYLSDRQWGTVREDYSPAGEAWDYFSHDQSHARAYRWGEDGLLGISDEKQRLCFSLALWNGRDPVLKERLFGLTGNQGNHGEDVKEYYFYLDSTPTHSYLKALYKYPQAEYPYKRLVEENQQRGRHAHELELLDTGVFDDNRYFDVFIEYAKASPQDMLIQISIANRSSESKTIHVLPHLWFRNTWAWDEESTKPKLSLAQKQDAYYEIAATHAELGEYRLYCDRQSHDCTPLFTENESNYQHLFGTENPTKYVKDAVHRYVIHDDDEAVNPERVGTKYAAHYAIEVPAGETRQIKLRLCDRLPQAAPFGSEFEQIVSDRIREADEFYQKISPFSMPEEQRHVQRQAFAGLLWTKQY
ncbi:MAG: glucosidase, partial [Cyanobacteria bacterium J06639_1]